MNIVEPILFQARQNPPVAAICAPGTTLNVISYARLERFINNIARRALGAGICPGNIVAVLVKDQIFHAAITLALAHVGVATLSVGDLHLPAGLRLDAVIADAGAAIGNRSNLPIIPVGLDWTEGDGKPIDARFVSPGGEALARVVLTSGSTGAPKAIGLSHAKELLRRGRFLYAFGSTFLDCSRLFSDMALGMSTCFQLMLYILSRGGTFFFPGASAMDSLQTFDLYKVQGLFASPGGLSGFLKFYEENTAFRPPFNVILTTGSRLPKSLSERVRARLSPNLVVFYGTSETTTVATAPAYKVADIPGAVGHVMPGVTVEIVDAERRTLPAGREGSVRIRSSMAVDGYLGDIQPGRDSFIDGFYYPGDLGYLAQDGMLVISGREKEVLNLGGAKISPQLVEEILTSFGSVDQAAVVDMPNSVGVEEIWALIVPRSPLNVDALRVHCEQRLPPNFRPVRFITVAQLPRNENGKIDRRRLHDLANGREAASAALPRPS
jgi:acyl-coenzyme A synthetase/AMP-(fatty) acid ligase